MPYCTNLAVVLNIVWGGIALPNLTEDFYVCQMPEYDEKQKSPPGPQFRGTV